MRQGRSEQGRGGEGRQRGLDEEEVVKEKRKQI